MSTDHQAKLGAFNSAESEAADNPNGEEVDPEHVGRGAEKAARSGRPKCGAERYDGGECRDPVMPGGFDRCWRHLHADGEDESETAGTEERPVWERQMMED